jgi:AcrR family transcriptional regulator
MQETMPVHEKLSARKKASQPRSQKMVKDILDATRGLLKKSGDLKLSKITTNHIAREAGVSVGSLYQYFPNKEVILFELYKEMLGHISSVLEEFNTETLLSLPREEFFDRLIRAMKDAESDVEVVFKMHNAMKTYPMLAEADRHHAEQLAKEIANFMQHFGSKWPVKKLQRLALHIYYIDYGSWMYRDHVHPAYQEVNEWEISALNFMVAKCFN